MASERTSHLTNLDPTGLGGKKREKREKERKKESLERKALHFLQIFRRSVHRIPAIQEVKLIPNARAMRGYQYCGVSETPGGRGLHPT